MAGTGSIVTHFHDNDNFQPATDQYDYYSFFAKSSLPSFDGI